jgi:hypothetical protein
VVDLERAQGLVRDHVIFSPGFGRTPHGRALHNFGPLSAEGGREKFALAMTRARRSMHVLTCFRPEDLDHTRLTHGAVDLYTLLDREISGNTDLGTPASRAAASEQALGADPLVADLGDRLRARGARVWHQYDGAIDVVAAADPLNTMGQDESDLPRPVAIESDGTAQYRTMSVRERSRLRPQLLERLGWRYMPLWTIEVFTDPSTCADRIAGYLGLEKMVLPARTTPSAGFLDDDFDQAFHGMAASSPAGVSYLPSEDRGKDSGSQQEAGMNGHQAGTDASGAGFGRNGQGRRASAADNREAASPTGDSPTANSAPEEDLAANEIGGGLMRGDETHRDENGMNGNTVNDNAVHGNGTAGPENQGDAGDSAKPASDEPAARTAKGGTGDILPSKAAEDDARSWGDRDDDHDTWLKEQRPPHWG